MADVVIKYKGSAIAEMSDSGSKTLATSGKYCEGDIVVEYEAKETGLANVKRWDVSVTNGLPSSGAYLYLVEDQWLAENRENPNLCVLVLPKFTIPHSATDGQQGLYLSSNMSLMTDSSGVLYASLGAYVKKDGSVLARARKYKLTNANDAGDIGITSGGKLYAVSYSGYPLATGDYVVFAFIV